jgi:hypothetical protein
MNHDTAGLRRSTARYWRTALLIVALPTMLGAIVWAASVASDSNRVPAEIAASARGTGVMLCAEGTIDHGNDSLWERILSAGDFRCTAWRMRGKSSSTTTAVDWPSSPRR